MSLSLPLESIDQLTAIRTFLYSKLSATTIKKKREVVDINTINSVFINNVILNLEKNSYVDNSIVKNKSVEQKNMEGTIDQLKRELSSLLSELLNLRDNIPSELDNTYNNEILSYQNNIKSTYNKTETLNKLRKVSNGKHSSKVGLEEAIKLNGGYSENMQDSLLIELKDRVNNYKDELNLLISEIPKRCNNISILDNYIKTTLNNDRPPVEQMLLDGMNDTSKVGNKRKLGALLPNK